MSRQKSTSSDGQSDGLKRRYQRPKTVGSLAAQAADVATRLLNGDISLEEAKAYSAIVRGISQLTTARVAQARARKTVPDTSLDGEIHEE